jgi:hypothetical protein
LKVTDGAPDGGTLSTPELVFQGTRTGYLKVYDARTGKKLKEIFTGTGSWRRLAPTALMEYSMLPSWPGMVELLPVVIQPMLFFTNTKTLAADRF